MSKIDVNHVWDDCKAMGRANKDLLSAIAGMFLLLPLAVALQFIAMPEGRDPGAAPTPEAIEATYRAFIEGNWHILFGTTLTMSFGTLAMLVLLLRPGRLTVGEALKAALFVLPSYLLASMLQNVAIQLGLLLFVIPALYLSGRFALIAAVAAAETEYNPITLVVRSFKLTHGNGWRVFGMQAVAGIALGIVGLVLIILAGLISALLMPGELGELLVGLIGSLVLSMIMFAMMLISAAIYRAATAPAATPWRPDR